MKKYFNKYLALSLCSVMLLSLAACKNKTEAVISDGEEITEAQAEYPTLEKSNAKKFGYEDLVVGKVTYLMTEDQVKNILGAPKDSAENNNQKVYFYNEMAITFEKLNSKNELDSSGGYKVTQVATSGDQTFSRGLKVGDKFDDILKVYYRDSNYQNHYYKSDDETHIFGKFLYGEFTVAELDKVNVKDEINYGLVDFNGFKNVETASSYMVELTHFDKDYIGDKASVYDDFASIIFEIDSKGLITNISWSYFPVEK